MGEEGEGRHPEDAPIPLTRGSGRETYLAFKLYLFFVVVGCVPFCESGFASVHCSNVSMFAPEIREYH